VDEAGVGMNIMPDATPSRAMRLRAGVHSRLGGPQRSWFTDFCTDAFISGVKTVGPFGSSNAVQQWIRRIAGRRKAQKFQQALSASLPLGFDFCGRLHIRRLFQLLSVKFHFLPQIGILILF
jgi:hypothetical protein